MLYIQQTLTGVSVSGKDANSILKKNNQYAEGNLLYTDSSKALEILTHGEYSFDFNSLNSSKNTNTEIIDRLIQAKASDSIESVRVYDGKHFVLLKDFNTETDINGKEKISSIEILNPLKNNRTSYSYEEIKRWDFFTAVKNTSVQNNPYQFAFIPSTDKYDRRASLWDY